MSEIRDIFRRLVDEFDTLCEEFRDVLKQWTIEIQIQDSRSDVRALKLQLRFPAFRMGELKTNCIAWQRKIDEFLAQTDPSRYYNMFLTLTSPDNDRSFYNLVVGNKPWVFADWNYMLRQENNTNVLQVIKSDVPLKLTTFEPEEEKSPQDLIMQIEKFINTHVKNQLLDSLETLRDDILAILRTYDSAEAITRLIEKYRIRGQGELLQQMRVEGHIYLNETDPSESKKRIICFITRFLLEQELKNRYMTKIGKLDKSLMLNDLLKLLNKRKLITDKQMVTFEEINQLCNQAIHETLPVSLKQIKEAFQTVETVIWG